MCRCWQNVQKISSVTFLPGYSWEDHVPSESVPTVISYPCLLFSCMQQTNCIQYFELLGYCGFSIRESSPSSLSFSVLVSVCLSFLQSITAPASQSLEPCRKPYYAFYHGEQLTGVSTAQSNRTAGQYLMEADPDASLGGCCPVLLS